MKSIKTLNDITLKDVLKAPSPSAALGKIICFGLLWQKVLVKLSDTLQSQRHHGEKERLL